MKRRILSTMLALIMSITVFTPLSAQAGSAPSSWAADEVNEAVEANLVTNSVKSDYQADITREQFCEMVVRAYEKISGEEAETGSVSFNDTSNGEILKAANLGIVSGYGSGKFGPDDLITREQIAAMLVRMIDKAVSYANVNVYNSNNFSDSDSISDWALPSINFAYDKEIMQGVGDNKIAPLDNTTCEQAVLLVYRTVKKYDSEKTVYLNKSVTLVLTDEMQDTLEYFCMQITDFTQEEVTTQDFAEKFIWRYYIRQKSDLKQGEFFPSLYYGWAIDDVCAQYKEFFGCDMPEVSSSCDSSFKYYFLDNGYYWVLADSDTGDNDYSFDSAVEADDGMDIKCKYTDLSGNLIYGYVTLHIIPTDNDSGFIITSKTSSTL